jgi:transcriptional regulator
MYQPAAFREDRRDVQYKLIRAHPLGLLITAGAGGLMANPIPFLLDDTATLRAHIARPNPQCQELAQVGECLVVFQGPQEYVTPSWYPSKLEHGRVVPTWNYATVHVWGRPRLIEDANWLRRQLDDLTRMKESPREKPWATTDAPPAFMATQMRGIVGVEIPISRIEGKWKVSQNRPEPDRAGVLAGLRAQGAPSAEMAALVADRGGMAPGS